MQKVYVDVHVTYKIYVNQLFMWLGRLLVNSRLLVKFWGSQNYMWIFEGGTHNPNVVPGQL